MPDQSPPTRDLLAALDALVDATRENMARSAMITDRIESLRSVVASGVPVTDAVRSEERPLIVELITQNVETLHSVGSRLRWAEARALREEGLTVTAIAELFGVTRQRVSALLQDPPKSVRSAG